MQVTARQKGQPLDNMTTETHMTTMMDVAQVRKTPGDGALIYGVYMEGARWLTGEDAGDIDVSGRWLVWLVWLVGWCIVFVVSCVGGAWCLVLGFVLFLSLLCFIREKTDVVCSCVVAVCFLCAGCCWGPHARIFGTVSFERIVAQSTGDVHESRRGTTGMGTQQCRLHATRIQCVRLSSVHDDLSWTDVHLFSDLENTQPSGKMDVGWGCFGVAK